MKLYKKIIIAILIILGIIIIFNYSLSITGKFGAIPEEKKLSGEILNANYEPVRPKILETVTVTMTAKNNGNEENGYLAEIRMIKDAELKYNDFFTFSLLPGNTLSFSPNYNPEDIGEYKIIFRLYNKDKSELYDEKILTFIAESDAGPFDLEIDLPSHIIGLDDTLPATIKIANMGIRGTDIGLNLDVYCTSGKILSKSMYIFLNGSEDVKKQFFVETCGDVGQHSLVASLTFYGKELLSSKNQFYVNTTLPEVLISSNNGIQAKPGETTDFIIELTNPNNFDLKNIKPFVYGIPSEWLFIKPISYDALKPNESIYFTVIVNIPETAGKKDYETKIGVGGDNVFSKKDAILSVTGSATKLFVSSSSFYQVFSSWISVISLYAIILLFCLYFKLKRKTQRQDKRSILKKIKDGIT